MGIDLRLRGLARGADISAVRAELSKHDALGWVEPSPDGIYLYVESLHRLYTEGYERGYWPSIRAMLVALQPLLPQLEYGGDEGHFHGELVCKAMLARLDALWTKTVSVRSIFNKNKSKEA